MSDVIVVHPKKTEDVKPGRERPDGTAIVGIVVVVTVCVFLASLVGYVLYDWVAVEDAPSMNELSWQQLATLNQEYLSEHEYDTVLVTGYLVRQPDASVQIRRYHEPSKLSLDQDLTISYKDGQAAVYQMYWDPSLTGASVTIIQNQGDRYGPLESLAAPSPLAEVPIALKGQIAWDEQSQTWLIVKKDAWNYQ